jgi:SAM-dependent methyltransferase
VAAKRRDVQGRPAWLEELPARLEELDEICARVESYYSGKLVRHGATPRGVDWSCQATQWLRFVQLLKVCTFDVPFSLNDLGCGYGALAAFLARKWPDARIDYLGIDLSGAMIRRARRRHRGNARVRFLAAAACPRQADFTVASGIMNVMLGFSIPLWESFVRQILADMNRGSTRGFAVNFIAALPEGVASDQLYCPSPDRWARFCETEFGCSVELADDYGLCEFTLLARHDPAAGMTVHSSDRKIEAAVAQ